MASLADSRAAAVAPFRGRAIAYWITTVPLAAEMLMGGMWGILRIPYAREMMQHLGYPDYFNVFLGIWYARWAGWRCWPPAFRGSRSGRTPARPSSSPAPSFLTSR
jgi:hypothetical protein